MVRIDDLVNERRIQTTPTNYDGVGLFVVRSMYLPTVNGKKQLLRTVTHQSVEQTQTESLKHEHKQTDRQTDVHTHTHTHERSLLQNVTVTLAHRHNGTHFYVPTSAFYIKKKTCKNAKHFHQPLLPARLLCPRIILITK